MGGQRPGALSQARAIRPFQAWLLLYLRSRNVGFTVRSDQLR